MKRTLVLATLIAAMAGVAASAASATDPVVVRCFGTGAATVPAGVPISVRNVGWAVGTRGQAQDFLVKQSTAETITTFLGGTTTVLVLDLTHTWSDPVFTPSGTSPGLGFWLTRPPDTDLGTLTAGEKVLVEEMITVSQPIVASFPPVGSSGDNGPFNRIDGTLFDGSCLITATAT